jgi:cephalosporin-C deacetylase-like acetyl esterase
MLRLYLLDQSRRQFDVRRKAIAAIKTPEDIARRQKELRAFFWRSLGDLPQRTPLNPQIVGRLSRADFRIEKVIFESRPNHHVTANLYLPNEKPPFPGILLPCGHSDNGKAAEAYQRACILLVKNGMAVLCYDPIGQGERFQYLDANGKPVVRGTNEHTMAGIGAMLVGRQLASYRIWDGIRALDYLASRPEIDASRLGCTGNSGGGTLTSYLMALDGRIAVAAPSCYITSLERLFATIGPQDAEQNITGQVAAGMEHADYITLRAPKPTLLTVGTRDFFDITGSWNTFREVKLIYGRLGFGERVDLFESDEEHGFTAPRRIATVRWMRRWLLKQDDAVPEPEFTIAADAELQCTQSGQVQRDFQDVSVFDLNLERALSLQTAREAGESKRTSGDFSALVKRQIGLADWKPARVSPRVTETQTKSDFVVRKLIFDVEPGIAIPALELKAVRPPEFGPTLVKVGASWKDELAPPRVKEILAGPHKKVVLVDPRGTGETAPGNGQEGRGSPFGRDWQEAYLAIHLARPLLGQRVLDLLTVLDSLDAEAEGERSAGFEVIGIGLLGPVALHAALIDGGALVKKVVLEKSLVSWTDVLEHKISRNQLSSVVPGALMEYDLPSLAARLAPRPLSIRAAVDAEGEAISRERLAQVYASCVSAYGKGDALDLGAAHGFSPNR